MLSSFGFLAEMPFRSCEKQIRGRKELKSVGNILWICFEGGLARLQGFLGVDQHPSWITYLDRQGSRFDIGNGQGSKAFEGRQLRNIASAGEFLPNFQGFVINRKQLGRIRIGFSADLAEAVVRNRGVEFGPFVFRVFLNEPAKNLQALLEGLGLL